MEAFKSIIIVNSYICMRRMYEELTFVISNSSRAHLLRASSLLDSITSLLPTALILSQIPLGQLYDPLL